MAENDKPVLCKVGGWKIMAVPGEPFYFGAGAVLWGPYRPHEIPQEYSWDACGLAYAEACGPFGADPEPSMVCPGCGCANGWPCPECGAH